MGGAHSPRFSTVWAGFCTCPLEGLAEHNLPILAVFLWASWEGDV